MPIRKITTLCLVHRHPKILLGMKKRGFGVNKWNGFGGKVAGSEDIEATAKRELLEECGLQARQLEKLGFLSFEYPSADEIVETHIFKVSKFTGVPAESEEMRPRWFATDRIPYDQMWPDDRLWLPLFLAGKNFRGRFVFNPDYQITDHKLTEI